MNITPVLINDLSSNFVCALAVGGRCGRFTIVVGETLIK
jgi:hypothetical protein